MTTHKQRKFLFLIFLLPIYTFGQIEDYDRLKLFPEHLNEKAFTKRVLSNQVINLLRTEEVAYDFFENEYPVIDLYTYDDQGREINFKDREFSSSFAAVWTIQDRYTFYNDTIIEISEFTGNPLFPGWREKKETYPAENDFPYLLNTTFSMNSETQEWDRKNRVKMVYTNAEILELSITHFNTQGFATRRSDYVFEEDMMIRTDYNHVLQPGVPISQLTIIMNPIFHMPELIQLEKNDTNNWFTESLAEGIYDETNFTGFLVTRDLTNLNSFNDSLVYDFTDYFALAKKTVFRPVDSTGIELVNTYKYDYDNFNQLRLQNSILNTQSNQYELQRKYVYQNLITSVTENNSSTSIIIYPNPVQNSFSIKGRTSAKLSCEIYNINGVLIKQELVKDNNVDVSALPIGMYFINVIDNEQCSFIKLMKI